MAEEAKRPASRSIQRELKEIFFNLESKIVRGQILDGEPRIDGRDTRTVRPITMRVGVLPRTHGSALFTRGETQALVTVTLGTGRDEQIIDALAGEYRERFMMHYNMPPYATGETGRMGPSKRREIGHGRLAKRALVGLLPTPEEFGYSMRVVSEITESNGSSSMASVCGGSLALMDAGVPVKAHVAGIAMGLIKEGNRFAVLSDILGDEDHLGDMDFKVAGTDKGITALQMDLKIESINKGIMKVALDQAREARLSILDIMKQRDRGLAHRAVDLRAAHHQDQDQPGQDPRRDRQGRRGDPRHPGGDRHHDRDRGRRHHLHRLRRRPRAARRRRSASRSSPPTSRSARSTRARCCACSTSARSCSCCPGRDGLLHISQISHERVNAVSDHLKEGQIVKVKVLEADDKGRVRLSMKAVNAQEQPPSRTPSESSERAPSRFREVLLRDLALAQLVERLAVDAQRRGRPRLQALQADLDAAAVAVAVLVRVDARDGLVDLLDQLALAVAVAQLERHVGFLAGAVVRIGEHRGLVLHGVHRAVDLLRQLGLERLEDLAEVLALRRRSCTPRPSSPRTGVKPFLESSTAMFRSKKRMRFVALKTPCSKRTSIALGYALRVSFDAFFGVWRSLVARLLWEQDVGGSNPLTPTSLRRARQAARSSTG